MPTATGWGLSGATVALLLVSWSTHYPQLWGLGLTGAALLLIGRALLPPLATLEVAEARQRSLARAPAPLAFRVANRGRRHSAPLAITVTLVDLKEDAALLARAVHPGLAPGAEQSLTVMTSPLIRGTYQLTSAIVEGTDVLGLFRRRTSTTPDLLLLVHPRTGEVDSFRRVARGRRVPPYGLPMGEEFETLRPYQPGDDVRTIHWPATARTGEPVVREMRPAPVVRPVVVLDVGAGTYPAEQFETAVEVAGSLALFEAATGPGWLLTTGTERLPFPGRGQTEPLLDALASVRSDSRADSLTLPRSATTVTVVTGGEPDERRWRSLAAGRSLVMYSVVPPDDCSPRPEAGSVVTVRDASDLSASEETP